MPSSLDETDTTATGRSPSPSTFIDVLLCAISLFVMQVRYNPSLRRDASPLIEHYRPGARVTLLHSRWFWLTAAAVLTAALLFGLQFSLQQLLHLLKHPAL